MEIFRKVVRYSKVQYVLRFVVDSFRMSPVHGISHLARRDVHWIELIFWILVAIVSTSSSIRLSWDLIYRYPDRYSSITVRRNYMTFNTTFPAFTFCPHNIIDKQKLQEFLQKQTLSEIEEKSMFDFLQILNENRFIPNLDKFKSLPSLSWIKPSDYMDLLFNLSISHQILSHNKVEGVRVMTELGICYTFNSKLLDVIKTKNWGDPFTNNIGLSPNYFQPKNIFFYFKFPIEGLFIFKSKSEVFNIYIHWPYDIPSLWSRKIASINTSNNEIVELTLDVTQVEHQPNYIQSMDITRRKCRGLRESNSVIFDNFYAPNICVMECRLRYAISRCGCIPHFYAHYKIIKHMPNRPICNIIGLSCLSDFRDNLLHIYGNLKIPIDCDCLPHCKEIFTIFKVNSKPTIDKQRKVKFKLLKAPIGEMQRISTFSNVDHAVAIGNVLSVFLGFSLLGFVDVIYFLTIRLYYYRRGYFVNSE